MAAENINPMVSHDSEDRDRGSNKLMESHFVPEHQLILIAVIVSFTSSQAITWSVEAASIIPILFVDFNVRLWSRMSRFVGTGTYTVTMVLEAYALLLVTNKRHLRIVFIPLVILVFIGALCGKFRENHSFGYNRKREATLRDGTESTQKLMKMAMVSYILQLSFVIWTHYWQQGSIFIFSGFLLFFNSALGALAVMIATPPVGVSPGVAQVLPVLHETCITVLLITTHTMAAEWLGEDIIFACMPELIAVLVWFTNRFNHAGHAVSVRLFTSGLVILSSSVGVILAYLANMYANDRTMLASWYRRAFCISGSSSALSYFHAWLLHQWPGSTSNSNGPIELLKISTKVCFSTTAILFCVPLVGAWTLDAKSTAAVLILLLLTFAIFRRRLSWWAYRILAFLDLKIDLEMIHDQPGSSLSPLS